MKHEEISLTTKRALAAALKDAMARKPLQKITVTELIRAADVNRKTFYYHFSDIYELLKWTLEEEALDEVKHYDLLRDYERAIAFIMDYVERNDYIITCAWDAMGQDGLKRFFRVDFQDIVEDLIASAERRTAVTLEADYRAFLTQFYIEALSGMLIQWIQHRDSYDRDRVAGFTIRTIRDSLLGILRVDPAGPRAAP